MKWEGRWPGIPGRLVQWILTEILLEGATKVNLPLPRGVTETALPVAVPVAEVPDSLETKTLSPT
jgi:hypothetical protein